MQTCTTPVRQTHPVSPIPDERWVMLEEIDFKWLMSGQGWWIDTTRLHSDPSYATHLLELVEVTQSEVLKDCAAMLRVQLGTHRITTTAQATRCWT